MAAFRAAVLLWVFEGGLFAAFVQELEDELEEHGEDDDQGSEGEAARVVEDAAPEGFADVGLVLELRVGVAEVPVRGG